VAEIIRGNCPLTLMDPEIEGSGAETDWCETLTALFKAGPKSFSRLIPKTHLQTALFDLFGV